MLEILLSQNENKTLEFKENTKSLTSIIKAVIAFANTAGGTIIIGVTDKDKKIIGVDNPLKEEERLASCITDSITPLLIPDIQIQSIRNRELLIIQIPHIVAPFYLKSAGLEQGTYVRVGSTNRVADKETILSLQLLAKNTSFDELPCIGTTISDIDDEKVETSLFPTLGNFTKKQYESLNITTKSHNKAQPCTNAGILLFGINRFKWFPDSSIACVCFTGETHEEIIDQKEIKSPLIMAHEEVLAFIKRHTNLSARIHESAREDISQYPPKALREALINAIVHADYSLKGSRIQISIFSNRIEITNPGGLPYGQTMESALSGISRMRNRVIGRLFREVKLIEQLGTGLKRIINVYEKTNAQKPIFQELNTHFRVTLYSINTLPHKIRTVMLVAAETTESEKAFMEYLREKYELGTTEIAKFWNVTTRTARSRLQKMVEKELIYRIGTSKKDPYGVFKLKE